VWYSSTDIGTLQVHIVTKFSSNLFGVTNSAGIGRSGVFIASDIGMKHLEENGMVDVLKIVSTIRQDRGGMVQTVSQYHFVYKVGVQL